MVYNHPFLESEHTSTGAMSSKSKFHLRSYYKSSMGVSETWYNLPLDS